MDVLDSGPDLIVFVTSTSSVTIAVIALLNTYHTFSGLNLFITTLFHVFTLIIIREAVVKGGKQSVSKADGRKLV